MNILLHFFHFAVFIFTIITACPKGWTSVDNNKMCLRVLDQKTKWSEANEKCSALMKESKLASFTTDAEKMSILQLGDKVKSAGSAWVGMNYDMKSTKFKWVDGSLFDPGSFKTTFWVPGKPEQVESFKCVAFYTPLSMFSNFNCDSQEFGLCRISEWSKWSDWSQCSQTCDEGVHTRSRSCPLPNRCPAKDDVTDNEKEACTIKGCPLYSQWGEWSECSRTCNYGQTTKSRKCVNGPGCVGKSTMTKGCNMFQCPEWAPWEYWEACSKSCGGGVQLRERHCNIPGKCEGESHDDRACNEDECRETSCPKGYQRYQDKCYQLTRPAGWDEAVLACNTIDGHLVYDYSEENMCNMRKASFLKPSDSYWLSDFRSINKKLARVFGNNKHNSFNALIKSKSDTFNTLCEVDFKDICFNGWEYHNDYCFKVINKKQNFKMAEAACVEMNGHLISIHSELNVEVLFDIMQNTSMDHSVWIGLNDRAMPLSFEFTDASQVRDFLTLNLLNQPRLPFRAENERCFVMKIFSNKLNILASDCRSSFAFLCKTMPPKHHNSSCENDYLLKLNVKTPPFRPDYPECPDGWDFVRTPERCTCWLKSSFAMIEKHAELLCKNYHSEIFTLRHHDEKKHFSENYNDAVVWARHQMKPKEDQSHTCFIVSGNNLNVTEEICFNWWHALCQKEVSCNVPTTPRPLPTLGAVEKVVATVVQTMGGAFIVGILAVTIVAFWFLRNFCLERCILMSEEVSLLAAYVLIMTGTENFGNDLLCHVIAYLLHYFFLVYFTFVLLETIQVYTIVTCVQLRGGLMNRAHNLIIGWVAPLVVVFINGLCHHNQYITRVMCFFDLTGGAATVYMIPFITVISLSMIMVEATGMAEELYPKIAGFDKTQMGTCKVSQRGLVIIIPLSVLSWLFTLIAISQQNIGLFSICFPLNTCLGVAMLVFHALANAQVRFVLVRSYRALKGCCKKAKVEDGSFESDFKDHTYNLW